MFRLLQRVSVMMALLGVLTACGGGGGSPSNTSTNNTPNDAVATNVILTTQ